MSTVAMPQETARSSAPLPAAPASVVQEGLVSLP